MLIKKAIKKTISKLGYEIKKKNKIQIPTPINFAEIPNKIHYACGKKPLDSWLNTDYYQKFNDQVVTVDLINKHPFPNNFFKLGYCQDFIEHLPQPDSMIFLAEVFRTFKPGGVCRLAFPGMDGQVYLGPPCCDFESAKKIKDEYYDKFGHVHLYSKDEFEKVCRYIGFQDVVFVKYQQSNVTELSNLETRNGLSEYYIYVEIHK